MSDTPAHPPGTSDSSIEEQRAALFANLVMQQANMALSFLGERPRSGDDAPAVDLPTASMFIDTLDTLEARTRGNLSPEEAALLKQTLTTLRIRFVQASSAVPAAKASSPPATPPSEPAAAPTAPAPESTESGKPGETASAETRKKFVKHY